MRTTHRLNIPECIHFDTTTRFYTLLFIFDFVLCIICRETDIKGVSTYSKCKMYDVNWTTIQSWDYENWNSTRHNEKLNVLGKYWQVTKLNKRKKKIQRERKQQRIPGNHVRFYQPSYIALQRICRLQLQAASNVCLDCVVLAETYT